MRHLAVSCCITAVEAAPFEFEGSLAQNASSWKEVSHELRVLQSCVHKCCRKVVEKGR